MQTSPFTPAPARLAGGRLRVAVLGCGAVTRASLLPVLAGHDRIEVVALVDRDVARARELASAYGVRRVEADIAAVTRQDADAIVLATPPAHHAPATLALVAQGFHVMVEKPMAITGAEAEAMADAAERAGVVLSVGLYRRLLPVTRLLRAMLEQDMLGRPVSIDIEEGGEYTWQLATMSVLTREGGGGGVLIDLGTHLLDQLLFVVPGPVRLVRHADNARGGIETDCEVRLEIDSRWGLIPARVELSRTRQLRGTIRVTCERGTLELVRSEFCRLRVEPDEPAAVDPATGSTRPFEMAAHWSDQPTLVGYKAFREEFDDWLRAIESGGQPQLSGQSVVPVVRLIEACYASVEPLAEPWTDEGLDPLAIRPASSPGAPFVATGRRPRVLVTGAGGFVGCRTVELMQHSGDWDVRALVRRPGSAARLARFPVEIVLGDVQSAADMRRAVEGCDAVVHCAVGTGWPPAVAFKTTVEGTKTTGEAALAAGVRRFVHVSSMAVHGDQPPPRLDEHAPLVPGSGVGYSRAKYLAEEAVATLAGRGLPAISLRPARIYGPLSRTFTVRPLAALRAGGLVLAGDADSPANMVYVDNVVEAILRALVAPAGENGQAFLVSESDQLSWRAFYEFFARHAGAEIAVEPYPPPASKQRGTWRRWVDGGKAIAFSPELRGFAKRILATDPYGTLPRKVWDRSPALQQRVLAAMGVDQAIVYREPAPRAGERTVFRIDPTLVVIDKAAARLGYAGLVPRSRAMDLTLAWAREARLV